MLSGGVLSKVMNALASPGVVLMECDMRTAGAQLFDY